MNEIERIVALMRAGAAIRMYRDGGVSWHDISKNVKTCNPLGLSPRQLSRIYEGDGRYRFDRLKRFVSSSGR